MKEKISVIIPTLNAQDYLPRCLQSIFNACCDLEVIISDGGSHDQTLALAEDHGLKITHSPQGRGTQLNEGMKQATGDVLVFLHADSIIPSNTFDMLQAFFFFL